jgi:hypothetical protein
MHVLVVATPRDPIPPEHLGPMIDASLAWYDRYADKFIAFGTFPGGGGFGVVEVDDAAMVGRMVLEMPFSAVSNHDVRIFTPGRAGMEQFRDIYAQMAAGR